MNRSRLFVLLVEFLSEVSDDGSIEYYNPQYLEGAPWCSSAKIRYDGVEIEGWGYGSSEAEANIKSLFELLERFALVSRSPTLFRKYKKFFKGKTKRVLQILPSQKLVSQFHSSSSGCAIHTRRMSSERNAVEELIERHVILKAIALHKKPKLIGEDEVVKALKPYKYLISKIVFLYWVGPMNTFTAIACLSRSRGHLFGFGTARSVSEAIRKAYFEISGYFSQYENLESDDLISTLDAKVDPEFVMRYHLEGRSRNVPSLFFGSGASDHFVDSDIDQNEIFVSSLDVNVACGGKKITFWFSRAVGPRMQPLFFDYWREDLLNKEAIKTLDSRLVGDVHIIS